MRYVVCCVFVLLPMIFQNHASRILAQDAVAPAETPTEETPAPAAEKASALEKWDRLIYVPFRELKKVFDNQDASVVLPYAEYLDLMKRAINAVPVTTGNQDAVISSSLWTATVEKDLARITVELRINVMKSDGWATLPLAFGAAAIGSVEPADGSVLLKGTGEGTYELLLTGAGQKSVKLQLLATVLTSPEDRSFTVACPSTGISDLVVTIPEPDQSVKITPLQVLLPAEDLAAEGKTVVRASLGATNQFSVHWNPRAGSKPVMDLLSSVTNQTSVHIEQGLLQSKSVLNYEILRGELRDVTVLVPRDARIIDVVSAAGRIRSWKAEPVGETHQLIRAELLVPATQQFQLEVQTERSVEGDTLQLLGKSADGKLHGVHADAVVREAGRLNISTDPSLTTVIKTQTGVKQIDAGSEVRKGTQPGGGNTWEFSGLSGALVVQIKAVEPRLLVTQNVQYVFRDDELRQRSVISYTVERAGVFQLKLKVPESLIIDSVSADGMSEFNVDKGAGVVTLSLTQKRMGAIEVTVQAHQAFASNAENAEMELGTLTPEGVERETGLVTIYAPEFLDVITVDEKLIGLYPSRDTQVEALPRLRHIASWNYTRRPIVLFVRTSPRPAQIAASVGTTVYVEPEIVKQNAVVTFEIQNAGIDTFRIAVPEAVADDVRFRALSGGHSIQQRNKAAEAVDGWVTWTLTLQDEASGTVSMGVDWDVKLTKNGTNAVKGDAGDAQAAPSDTAAADTSTVEQSLVVEPPRVLPPFDETQADRRRVTLTQVRGEMRLLRHESLSITADSQGETTEAIDVRELELLEQDGYLAYRYFAQPASATIRIRRHEIHEVAATVVSRTAIDVVTERQALAAWRARFRITTSERQRLRIDLPAGSDLQAPLLNDRRTTIEKATDVKAADQWEAYYVNISRDTTSDQEFLLTLQYRCAIVEEGARPYSGQGGLQKLRLPVIGDSGGSSVVQHVKLAVWAPERIAFLGDPELWTQEETTPPSIWNPLRSGSADRAVVSMNEWIDPEGTAAGDFPTQGNVAVFHAVGRQLEIVVTWWSRPFLFWMISGTLVLVGFVLRRTPWENRITLVLLVLFAIAMLSLSADHQVSQFVAMAWPGILVVGGIWLTGLLIGQKNGMAGNDERTKVIVPLNTPPAESNAAEPAVAPPPMPATDTDGSVSGDTSASSPEIHDSPDDQAGGGK